MVYKRLQIIKNYLWYLLFLVDGQSNQTMQVTSGQFIVKSSIMPKGENI